MTNTKTQSLLGLVMLCIVVLIACGSATETADEDTSGNETDSSSPPDLQTLLAKGITVEVSESLPGTWNVQGYNIAEETPDCPETTSQVTFNDDGTFTPLSAMPLYDYDEGTLTLSEPGVGNVCAEIIVAEGVVRGEPTIDGLVDATLHYEIEQTRMDTAILRFVLEGSFVQTCCGTYVGACAETVGILHLVSETHTTGYLVEAAEENAMALSASGCYVVLWQ